MAIGSEQLAFDQAKRAQQLHHDGQGLVDHRVTDAVAAVTEIILAGDDVVEPGQVPGATALVGLLEIVTEAGIVDVLIHVGGHFEHDEAGRVVAGAASGPIMRRAERAGEAKVNRGADEPTQATFDIACGRQRERMRRELIVREPPAGGLGERGRKGLAVVLVESGSMAHKGVKVQGRELLAGKRYAVSAHSSSSSQRGQG